MDICWKTDGHYTFGWLLVQLGVSSFLVERNSRIQGIWVDSPPKWAIAILRILFSSLLLPQYSSQE